MAIVPLVLLYVPGTPPRRERQELSCERRGEAWSVRPPGTFTCRGEVFVAEPAHVAEWLRGAIAPFGGRELDGEHLLPSEEQFRAFVASIEPVLSARSRWPWAPAAGSTEVLERADLDRLVALFPHDALLRLERAKLSVEVKEVEAALALRRDPETLLAASYVFAGEDRPRALGLLEELLAREPAHEGAARSYLTLLELEGRWADFLVAEDTVASWRPRGAGEWNRRGGVLERAGRLEDAAEALGRSLGLRDEVMLRVRRGKLLARLGRDDEALAELDAGLPRCADFDGHLARADLLVRRGELAEAEKVLRWVALAPSHQASAEERLKNLRPNADCEQ